MRVLVVEDEPDMRDAIAMFLREENYSVDTAADGKEGLYKARNWDYDAIILDVMLPLMDGWTVARSLRADPQSAQLKIIAMTAHAMAGDREKALEAGCNDYHPKPIDFPRLLNQIQELAGPAPTDGAG